MKGCPILARFREMSETRSTTRLLRHKTTSIERSVSHISRTTREIWGTPLLLPVNAKTVFFTASTLRLMWVQGLCQFSYAAMAVKAAAIFFAASSIQSVPFCALAGLGSPITPLGAISLVSQAKFAGAFSGRNISGLAISAM